MKIESFIAEGCSSEPMVSENVRRALEVTGAVAEVAVRRVNDEEARALGIAGSPTVLVDGLDVAPAQSTGFT